MRQEKNSTNRLIVSIFAEILGDTIFNPDFVRIVMVRIAKLVGSKSIPSHKIEPLSQFV